MPSVRTTAAYEKIIQKLDPINRAVMVEWHAGQRQNFRKIGKKHAKEPESIAHAIHGMIDEVVKEHEPTMQVVTCKKGCAACCYLPVTVLSQEASLMHHVAAEAGVVLDQRRLAVQAAAGTAGWSRLDHADRRCVMLKDDNTCGIYDYRPAACRKYFVASDPAKCDLSNDYGALVKIYVIHVAEVILSAAFEVWPIHDTIAASLLRVPKSKEQI